MQPSLHVFTHPLVVVKYFESPQSGLQYFESSNRPVMGRLQLVWQVFSRIAILWFEAQVEPHDVLSVERNLPTLHDKHSVEVLQLLQSVIEHYESEWSAVMTSSSNLCASK